MSALLPLTGCVQKDMKVCAVTVMKVTQSGLFSHQNHKEMLMLNFYDFCFLCHFVIALVVLAKDSGTCTWLD
jgi:hypothetical protein